MTLESAVNEYVNARKIVGNHPLSEIIRFWQTHRSDTIPDKPLSKIIDEFLAAQKRDGVSLEYLGELKRFLTHVAERFRANIMSITPSHARRVPENNGLLRWVAKHVSAKTGCAFNFARRLGYTPGQVNCGGSHREGQGSRSRDRDLSP